MNRLCFCGLPVFLRGRVLRCPQHRRVSFPITVAKSEALRLFLTSTILLFPLAICVLQLKHSEHKFHRENLKHPMFQNMLEMFLRGGLCSAVGSHLTTLKWTMWSISPSKHWHSLTGDKVRVEVAANFSSNKIWASSLTSTFHFTRFYLVGMFLFRWREVFWELAWDFILLS